MTPVAKFLLRLGVSPDVVTLVGTLGVCVGALGFYPRHEFFWGTIVVTVFVFSDNLDGTMARMSGRSGNWGPSSTPPSTGWATRRSSAGWSSGTPGRGTP